MQDVGPQSQFRPTSLKAPVEAEDANSDAYLAVSFGSASELEYYLLLAYDLKLLPARIST